MKKNQMDPVSEAQQNTDLDLLSSYYHLARTEKAIIARRKAHAVEISERRRNNDFFRMVPWKDSHIDDPRAHGIPFDSVSVALDVAGQWAPDYDAMDEGTRADYKAALEALRDAFPHKRTTYDRITIKK